MDKIGFSQSLSKLIAEAIKGGTHHMDIVATLASNQHSLLTQAFDNSRTKPSNLFSSVKVEDGGSN